MNNFHFTGRLSKAPVLTSRQRRDDNTTTHIVKFALLRNEYAGKDWQGQNKERVVSPYFTLFGSRAEFFAKNAMVGDQIIVTARLQTDPYEGKDGKIEYSTEFIVEDFEFGAAGKAKQDYWAKNPRSREGTQDAHYPHDDDNPM